VVRILLCALFSSIFIAPVSNAASDTTLLTICTSLRTDYQYISASGKCNERIYEKSTWYQPGMAPRGTLGSKTVSITLCTSKSRSNLRILAKEGRSCNRNSQTQSIFQRPLGPPAAPELVSVIADTLGTAIITMKAPLEDGGARIRSYEVIEVGSTTPANKVLATIATSFPVKAQQSTKISGLIPSQSYRFAIRAINAIGASPLAQSSSVFLAPTLPGAPSITSAVASSFNSAQITYSPALSDGGSPVTSYTITALPGRLQSTFLATDAKHHTFTGLSALTNYTFTIQATNIAGSGLASAPSNQITTFAPPPPPEPVAPTPSPSPSSSAPALAAPAFTLSSSSETRTVNTVATGFTINSTGGAIASFAISATPAGMSFSTSTGALSGTPTTVASATAYTVTATNASGSATQTFTLTVSPGAATKAMMTTQPAGAVNGSAFTTQPVVRVTDSGGNTVTTSTAVVTVRKASGTGTLSGTTTATAVAGVATFTDLVITGTGDHVLTFTPETLTAVNSETLTVSLAAQATLSITSLTTNTKAHPYSQALSITTSGGSGTGAITFAIASGGTATGCALSDSTATATITATTVGTCLIQATKAADATYASTTSATATFTFQVGSANKAMMTTQPAGAVNGVALTTQPVVRVTDSGDNTVTSFTGDVEVSIASGTGTLSGNTVAAVAGVATFTNLVITGTAGNFTLTFTPASLTAVTSSSFALAAGAASKVAITLASVGTTDNVAFSTQPQITIQDASGNTVSSSAVVTATISAGSLIGTTTATASSGVATFTGLGIDGTPGTAYTITYTVSGLTVATATVTLAALTCATGGTCSVGDTGPGGGKVFYVTTTPFACGPTGSETCRYLEAAPADWIEGGDPERTWAVSAFQSSDLTDITNESSVNNTSTGIGLGYRNSELIRTQNGVYNQSSNSYAAGAARAYQGGSKSDWYLPTTAELNLLCQWARGVAPSVTTRCTGGTINRGPGAAGFKEDYYWSSSESGSSSAWSQTFSDGFQHGIPSKSNSEYVRPVRAFFGPPIVISVAAIAGVTAPVTGATPVTTTTDGTGYRGVVTWTSSSGALVGNFAGATIYTATITLTATSGYTLTGVSENFFTVAGATTDTNPANSGVITAVFPRTLGHCDGSTFTCQVGDTGPGGGKIFYVATTPFDCGPERLETCRYLEAAPNTWSGGTSDPTRSWAVSAFQSSDLTDITNESSVNNTSTGIGLGYRNSELITTQNGVYNQSNNSYAAGAARAYQGGSKSDWYLPTTAELNQMCKWQSGITGDALTDLTTVCTGGILNSGLGAAGFVAGYYWSSSEGSAVGAWFQFFVDGVQDVGGKSVTFYVRPVRAF
jgi:hypothetical protein